jgi:hypothetical protein
MDEEDERQNQQCRNQRLSGRLLDVSCEIEEVPNRPRKNNNDSNCKTD